jgi:hypothetical protein
MLCKSPYIKDGIPYGCGQCLPCRINKRRLWTHRIMLESKLHQHNSFLTLTYDDDNIPLVKCEDGNIRGNLVPKHLQDFMKRLRKKISPVKIRYVSVGEYGDKSQRPHYHLALFGYPSCAYGKPRVRKNRNCQCPQCQEIQETWNHGFTYNGELTDKSASYVAGYVTKKMTNPKNEQVQDFLKGRHQEFARMSNRPGIAADAMEFLVEVLESKHGVDAIIDDVPDTLQHGKRQMPLGRYLKEKLRKRMGFEETGTPKEVLHRMRNENLQEAVLLWKEAGCPQNTTQEKLLLNKNKQKVRNLEKRHKVFSQKRSI